MKHLLTYLKGNIKECIIAPCFKLFEAILELLVPIIMARVIDEGIGGGNPALVWKFGLWLLALAAVGLVAAISAQFFAARAATGFSTRLKSALLRHIYSLSFKQTDELSVPTLMTRMTDDVAQIQTGVNLTLRLLLRSPLIVIGSTVMAFLVDPPAAAIFALLIALLTLCVVLVMRRTLPGFRNVQKASDAVLGETRESLTGVRVIRAFGREEEERKRFDDRHEYLTQFQLKTQKIAALLNPATLLLVDTALAVLIHFGAIRVNIGILTQGQVVALTNYMSQILVELIKLADLLITISKSLACAGRVADVLSIVPNMTSGTEVPDWNADIMIQLNHVSLSYNGKGREALHDLSLTIKNGESLGIIGGTGAGKSTVGSLIPRFYDATSGNILIGGHDILSLDIKKLRDGIGYVPQKAHLFIGTIRDNLKMGNREARDDQLWEALKTAQAYDFVNVLPDKLDTTVEQNGKNFSGGQRQRLTIARALVRRPHILILDDSASALDAQTDAALRQALAKDEAGVTTLIISQRASSVMHLSQILVLDGGQVMGIGTHEELMKSCPTYLETYEAQFPGEVNE